MATRYPETAAGGFTAIDGTVQFYTRINALLRADMHVLDYGAGRGQALLDDPVDYRRNLQMLRGKVASVTGADIDPAVNGNPGVDRAVVIEPEGALPFENDMFDLVVSDFTLEHIAAPGIFAREMARVVKPGGWFCARTPNKWGYIGLGARLVPNRLHVRLLRGLQPQRKEVDVFPTVYSLNTRRELRRFFPYDLWHHALFTWDGEPAYTGGSPVLAAMIRTYGWLMPRVCGSMLMIFLQRRTASGKPPGVDG